MTIKQQGGIFGRNPTFNDLTAGSGSSIEGSGENVTFSVDRTDASTAGALVLRAANGNLSIDSDGADKDILIRTGGGTERARFYGDNGDFKIKGNLVVDSGQGIDFSATSGTGTSELFDDYEQGTFSAVLADASSGGNTASTGNTYAQYTKVGNIVHCTISMLNINTSGMTPVNLAYLQGLPYASVSAGSNRFFPIYVRANGITSTLGIQGWILANAGDYIFLENVTTSGKANLLVSAFSSGTADLAVSFSYFTN